MAVCSYFPMFKPSELDRKIVDGDKIRLSKGTLSVTVMLKDWNRLGMEAEILRGYSNFS